MDRTKPTQQQVLDALLRLAEQHQVPFLQVILFGSHARGEATPTSDYDLLVVVPNWLDAKSRRKAAGNLGFDLGYDLAWPVDVIVASQQALDGKYDPLIEPIRRTGSVIYQQLNYAYPVAGNSSKSCDISTLPSNYDQ